MRILAFIFCGFSFYGLLQFFNVEVYQFLPAHAHGPEDGMIVAAIALMFGGGASLFALLFAFLHFRRARSDRWSRPLLLWCSLVPLGFLAIFVYGYVRATYWAA